MVAISTGSVIIHSMLKQTVTLIQTPKAVLWAERGRYYKTLALAKAVVMKEARYASRNLGVAVITNLTIR
jgi:hypothetical protein